MSEPEVQAACFIAAGIGALICMGVARHYRRQDEKDAARRAELHRHVEAELRRPR